jgi:peptidoglycan/LPS O-acetylase OafA/YrhL
MHLDMRINNLDYLRGLMAFSIMIYHYSSWIFGDFNSETLLGVFGIYGVSIFYILSGITLYIVYHKKSTKELFIPFFVKRIFRIFPLMWLTILLSYLILNQSFDFKTYFINMTGLFGFIEPSNYIVTGAWSIGNELVFYSLFPLIILFSKNLKYGLEICFIISIIIGSYFALSVLNLSEPLSAQWNNYINPFNQLFLFIGGLLIGKYFSNYKNNKLSALFFISCVIGLLFSKASGDKINLVAGENRFIYASIAFSITIASLISNFNLPNIIDKVFVKLGHISYSIYLMHAIVFWTVAKFINRTNDPYLFLSISVICTIISSLIVYSFYEKKFIKLGKSILK